MLFLAKFPADLKKQCGFSNTRRPTHKDERALYSASAQHAIQLAKAGKKPLFAAADDLRKRLGLSRSLLCRTNSSGRFGWRVSMLFQGIPGSAGGTLPHPLQGLIAAICAEINGFGFHKVSPLLSILCIIPAPLYQWSWSRNGTAAIGKPDSNQVIPGTAQASSSSVNPAQMAVTRSF